MKSKAYSNYRENCAIHLESLQLILDDSNISKKEKHIAIKNTKKQLEKDLENIYKILLA